MALSVQFSAVFCASRCLRSRVRDRLVLPVLQPLDRRFEVPGVLLETDEAAARLKAGHADRAGSGERIEHEAALGA